MKQLLAIQIYYITIVYCVISLCFFYCTEGKTPFPDSKENIGRFVGISKNKGNASTIKILTDVTNKVIHGSILHTEDDPKLTCRRSWIIKSVRAIENSVVETEADFIDLARLKLPYVDPARPISWHDIIKRARK